MAKRKISVVLRAFLAASLVLSMTIGVCSCSMIEDIIDIYLYGEEDDDDDDDPVPTNDRRGSKPEKMPKDSRPTYETIIPTGTYTSETDAAVNPDIGYVRDVYIYSVWYDAVDDNPAYYDEIISEDAFALKAVFYFSSPLTCTFEARLYNEGGLVLSREVELINNVTAEADFSAGLEGWGTFDPGHYTVELLYKGEQISVTSEMKVK